MSDRVATVEQFEYIYKCVQISSPRLCTVPYSNTASVPDALPSFNQVGSMCIHLSIANIFTDSLLDSMENYYEIDNLLMTWALPIFPPPTPEAPNFFETGIASALSDPVLSCSFQNIVNMVTGILTKALSRMEQITETGGHMAVEQVVRILLDELLPVL